MMNILKIISAFDLDVDRYCQLNDKCHTFLYIISYDIIQPLNFDGKIKCDYLYVGMGITECLK